MFLFVCHHIPPMCRWIYNNKLNNDLSIWIRVSNTTCSDYRKMFSVKIRLELNIKMIITVRKIRGNDGWKYHYIQKRWRSEEGKHLYGSTKLYCDFWYFPHFLEGFTVGCRIILKQSIIDCFTSRHGFHKQETPFQYQNTVLIVLRIEDVFLNLLGHWWGHRSYCNKCFLVSEV